MRGIGRRVVSFTLGTGISRVTGLFREMMMAYLFGVSKFTDSFLVAFTIPNLLRDMFAESALSASFIPILSKKDIKERKVFAFQILNLLILVTSIISVLGIVASPYIVKVMVYGFSKDVEKFNLTVSLTRWMFPYIVLISLSAWAMSILNSHHRFFIPAFSSTGFNLGTIVVTLATYTFFLKRGPSPIHSMALGVLAGGLIQFMIQVPMLLKLGYIYRPFFSLFSEDVKRAIRLWIPITFGFAFTRINVAVDTFLISFLKTGAVSYIKYAYRVMHLPLGLFGIAVGAVSLPSLSEAYNDRKLLIDRLRDSISLSLLLSIPASIYIIFSSNILVDLIFRYGRFTYRDSINTAWALSLYAIGIAAFSLTKTLNSLYYAHENTKTPTFFAAIGVLVNISLNASLMHIIGYRAFPLATSFSNLLITLLLVVYIKRFYGIGYREYFISPLKLVTVSFISGLPILILNLYRCDSIPLRFLKFLISLIVYLTIFIILLRRFLPHYYNMFMSLIRRSAKHGSS